MSNGKGHARRVTLEPNHPCRMDWDKFSPQFSEEWKAEREREVTDFENLMGMSRT